MLLPNGNGLVQSCSSVDRPRSPFHPRGQVAKVTGEFGGGDPGQTPIDIASRLASWQSPPGASWLEIR